MDVLNYFSGKLSANVESIDVAEEVWNRRAKGFYQNQVNKRDYFPENITKLLSERNILTKDTTVLDICSGSGRFALPFSEQCQSVLALDLSAEMLGYLQQEIDNRGITNISTIKSPWPSEQSIEQVDVAFAAMCPATRTLPAIKAMSNIAKKYGVISRYIYSSDNVIELLKEKQLLTDEDVKHPHNNRFSIQAYFNILWELGYNPTITYVDDSYEIDYSLKDAVSVYKSRYDKLNEVQLHELLKTIAVDGEVKAVKKAKLAVVIWDTRNKI